MMYIVLSRPFLCNYKSIFDIPSSKYYSSLPKYTILFNMKVDSYLKPGGDDVRFPGTVAIAEAITEAITEDGPKDSYHSTISGHSHAFYFYFVFP